MPESMNFHKPENWILAIHAKDGTMLAGLSDDPGRPSFVLTERLGEAAAIFLDEVIRLSSEYGHSFTTRSE